MRAVSSAAGATGTAYAAYGEQLVALPTQKGFIPHLGQAKGFGWLNEPMVSALGGAINGGP